MESIGILPSPFLTSSNGHHQTFQLSCAPRENTQQEQKTNGNPPNKMYSTNEEPPEKAWKNCFWLSSHTSKNHCSHNTHPSWLRCLLSLPNWMWANWQARPGRHLLPSWASIETGQPLWHGHKIHSAMRPKCSKDVGMSTVVLQFSGWEDNCQSAFG